MKRVLFIVLAASLTVGCSAPPQQAQWGQGYETSQGYQQPDHGYFYYWMLYHATMGFYEPRPVYHVYYPPMGYPTTYRPWQSREYVRGSDGRFVRQAPAPRPVTPAAGATPSRTSGGFSTPKPVVKDSRASGGFAPKPAPPPPQTRTSGGFSKPTTPSSSRSSGGFSSGKRR